MKKIFREFGVHFCVATILIVISLLIKDHDDTNREQLSLMIVLMSGALISIGGYRYLRNRKGIEMIIGGVIVLGIALFYLSFEV
ncbi:hypothetical protein ACFRAM_19205 [Paenibacillus sp. NPDC056722]|uniref:hypothetical protein n=1 Tax=Paenibacillus sp. NPDC056722 TaxID=3345924 RepID=UPI0036991193